MNNHQRSDSKGTFFIILASLVLFVAVAIIVILEFTLESRKPPEIPFYNVIYPYVEFRPHPNVAWHSTGPSPSSRSGDVAKSYTNQDSLRIPALDYRLDSTKPAGQIRIAMVGGSTVHAATTYEDTLPGALKHVLRAQNPGVDIEVINAGITSSISRQALVHLITALVDYNLDLLVVYDGINDSGQMLHYEERPNFPYNYRVKELAWEQYVSGKRDPIWKEILRRSAIVNRFWPTMFGESPILKKADVGSLIKHPRLRQTYAEAYVNNWEKIRRVCLAYHIIPMFVLQPTSLYATVTADTSPEDMMNSPKAVRYANYLVYEEMRKKTKAFSDSNQDIDVLDLSSLLPLEAYYDGAHVYDDINIQIAETLANSLRANLKRLIEEKAFVSKAKPTS